MEKTIKDLLKEYKKIKKEFDVLENKKDKISSEIIKLILKELMQKKDFNELTILINPNLIEKQKRNVFVEFVNYTVIKKVAESCEEFGRMLETYSPIQGRHYHIQINEFVKLVCNDYDYFGLIFTENNPEKIKSFCKEYGIKIKIGKDYDEVYEIEEQIKRLQKTKETFEKYQKIYGE